MPVRDARLDDLPTIVEFNVRLAEESENKRLDGCVLERGVRRALASRDMCRYFVAEERGAVVGQTMVTYELTDWRDGVLWWIQSVYVQPEARGRGVFRSLYEHIERLARADPEARGLRLYVEHHNETALATYERLGMRPSGHLLYEIDWS
ncbi:MAG TPA: GNAT family N-acetyltransferase [Pirellulales bacterium]|nr:GNAT family N-acetyltransferase [Pirellulales bacterium]